MNGFKKMLLNESTEFNDYDKILFSDYYELNKKHYDRKKSEINYIPSKLVSGRDDRGEKWMYVKKRDRDTITLATIDGICDHDGIVCGRRIDPDTYRNIKSKEDLDMTVMNLAPVRRFVLPLYDEYLAPRMHGKQKLYRGFNIPAEEFESWPLQERLKNNLIKKFSNTNKLYNSYTYDRNVAWSFASGNAFGTRRLDDSYAIMLEGEADASDIAWAFTAYLIGHHGNLNESELNVNCFKDLSNQDITITHIVKNGNAYIEV